MLDPIPSVADLGIDPEAVDELLPHLDSFVKWELLRFLHDNPDLAASLEDLARYLGRDETEVKPAARALVGAGLCMQGESVDGIVYSYTTDATQRRMVCLLVKGFLADRLVRLAISSHILKAQRRATRVNPVAR